MVGDHDGDERAQEGAPRVADQIEAGQIEPGRPSLTIVIITDFYHPYLGGVEQHVRGLAQTLAGSGHRVTVATLGRADLAPEEMDGDVRVCRMRSTTQRLPRLFSSAERPWAPPMPDPGLVLQLRRLIRSLRPDVVHGHDWMARSFLPLQRWAAHRFGTRFVASLHYYTLSCARKNLMEVVPAGLATAERPCSGPGVAKCTACAARHYGPMLGPAIALANQLGAGLERRAAATIVAVSRATAIGNGLAVDGPGVRVVPNFVTSAPSIVADRSRLEGLPDGDFIMFVGDLRPMKGIDVLLSAYEGLRTAMPLVLIGKTWPDTPTELPEGVSVHDHWPNSAVLEAWRRCTIAVVPSVWAEPFGIVVIEAMAAECAVVASACGGIPDIIDDGVNGVLVPPNDADALRRAIGELIADPVRRRALGAAAAQRAGRFGASGVVAEIEAVYRATSTRRSPLPTTSS